MAATAVLAGCGVTAGAHAPAVTSAPSTSPERTAAAATSGASAPERLPGSRYQTLKTVSGDNVFALDGDGDLLIGHSIPSKDKSELLGAEKLSVTPARGGAAVNVPTQDRSGHFQINASAISRRWVVWQETKSSSLGSVPWTMYAFNRTTRKVTRLTASQKLSDGHDPTDVPDYTNPVILGDRVYWIAMTGTLAEPHTNLYGCELTSCAPKLYAKDAAYVATDGRQAFALTYEEFNRAPVSTLHVLGVEADQSVREVAVVKLASAMQPMGLAVNSAQYMFLGYGKRTEMLTASRASSRVTRTVVGRQGENFGTPVATDRYLAWEEGSGTSSLQLAGYAIIGGRRYILGNDSGRYLVEGAGSYLVWSESVNPRKARAEGLERVVRVK